MQDDVIREFATFENNIVIYLIPFDICFAFFTNMKKSQIQFLYKKFRELQCFNLIMYFYLKSLNNYYVYKRKMAQKSSTTFFKFNPKVLTIA